jgi:TonB family protein
MLNTREFVFYGYFQRIRERLDHAWEKSLRDHLQKYFYRGRQLASETDYMTQLLVSLDKDGRITKVQIIGNSGTTELDEAATKAFNDAGPFPNPPTGLVDNRGQVLVRWDFVLKT